MQIRLIIQDKDLTPLGEAIEEHRYDKAWQGLVKAYDKAVGEFGKMIIANKLK